MKIPNTNEILYIGKKNLKDNGLKDIFIYTKSNPFNETIITAPYGYTNINKNGTQYVTLEDGKYYKKNLSTNKIQIGTFKSASQYISGDYNISNAIDFESMSLSQLIKHNSPKASAEFQWRLFFPLAVIITVVIALALCKINPRTSRFQKIIPGVIMFILYFNLMLIFFKC